MQYSPKLKKAMNEIEAILIKYDIAGIVSLHTPGHGEYLSHLSPSYSCAKFEGDNLRIRAKKEDYSGSAEVRNRFLKDTSNILHVLSNNTGMIAINLVEISKTVDNILGADHFGGGHSSHIDQNN